MTPAADRTFARQLDALTPALRSRAYSMTRNTDAALDLTQDTLLLAWANRGQFDPSSNLRAWTFTIMRNRHLSLLRKRNVLVFGELPEHAVPASQEAALHLRDARRAIGTLPVEQIEAVMRIMDGMSYAEAAAACGCAEGTIKSRVSRGREALAGALA